LITVERDARAAYAGALRLFQVQTNIRTKGYTAAAVSLCGSAEGAQKAFGGGFYSHMGNFKNAEVAPSNPNDEKDQSDHFSSSSSSNSSSSSSSSTSSSSSSSSSNSKKSASGANNVAQNKGLKLSKEAKKLLDTEAACSDSDDDEDDDENGTVENLIDDKRARKPNVAAKVYAKQKEQENKRFHNKAKKAIKRRKQNTGQGSGVQQGLQNKRAKQN
jgi:hypothetical protein